MKQELLSILKLLEKAMPPPEGCHHTIGYAQYGNDVAGWEDVLALYVRYGDDIHTLFFDDDDFLKDTSELVREIEEIVRNPPKHDKHKRVR